jgi:AcrR family transcriptional regulator
MTAARSAREVAILDAALDLVAEVGFDGVSMDAVAARARASKATIYRHWPGKAELVADAMRCRVCTDLVAPSTGSLRGDLLVMLEMMAEGMSGTDGRLMMGLLLAKERDPDLSRLLREQLHDAKRPVWDAICEQAVAVGELTDAAAGADLLGRVLPGLAFVQHILLSLPLDAAWRERTVDTVALPLLASMAPAVAAHA